MVDAPVTIRTATSADAARLNELHISSVRALCSGHYTQEILEGWLLNRTPSGYLGPISRGSIFVAELGDETVGVGEAARGGVVAVCVDPGAAGRGIGRRILQHALAVARSRECDSVMVEATLNARAFYERHGFREVRHATVTRNHVEVPIVVMKYDAA